MTREPARTPPVAFAAVHPVLAVGDLQRDLAYYRDRLGFEVAWQWGDPPVRAGVRRDGLELQLVADGRFAPEQPSVVYFHLRGIDAYYRACVERSAEILLPLDDRPFGVRDFRLADPSGNRLGFGEPGEPGEPERGELRPAGEVGRAAAAPAVEARSRPRTVLGLAGSLRRESCNRRVLEAAGELAPPGMTVAVYRGLAEIPAFDADLEAAVEGCPAPVRALRHEVARADALLISTPEYGHSLPGGLKNVIDWLSSLGAGETLAGKPVAVLGATPGTWGTRLAQSELRRVLDAIEALVMPGAGLDLRCADGLFDDAGGLRDPDTRARLGAALAALAAWIDECHQP